MNIIASIDSFVVDIYYKFPSELKNDYIKICEQIGTFFNENFSMNIDIIRQCNELLEYLFRILQSNDYIKMADALLYTVKPILVDTDD